MITFWLVQLSQIIKMARGTFFADNINNYHLFIFRNLSPPFLTALNDLEKSPPLLPLHFIFPPVDHLNPVHHLCFI